MPHFSARRYFNEGSDLCILPDLLREKFGIIKRNNLGSCLVAQVAFSLSVTTGIKPSRIVTHIFQHVKRRANEFGWTLEEVLETLNYPVWVGGVFVQVQAEVFVHSDIKEVFESIISGFPVITVFPRDAVEAMIHEGKMYNDGEASAVGIRKATDDRYHCLLGFGVSDDGFFVYRESRHMYGFKGYLKIKKDVLEHGFEHTRSFSIRVKI